LISAAWMFADFPAASGASAKSPVPAPAARAAATKFVADAFAEQIANAKKFAEKIALANKLRETGTGEQKDLAVKYALLTLAANTAAAAGDLQDAFDSVDQIDQTYLIDALKMKSQSALVAVKAARTTEDRRNFVVQIDPLIDQALAADRYDIAIQLGDAAAAQARLSNDAVLSTQANLHIHHVKATAAAYKDLNMSGAPADYKSADPNTNLKVGKFLCFLKGDWNHGVPLLAAGGDPTIKQLADMDLKSPTDAQQQYALAERWWNFADSASALEKTQIRMRASYWYQRAAPNLSGLPQLLAKKRASEAIALAQGGLAPDRAWIVLFRSNDPSIWNKDENRGENDFALALSAAPKKTRWVRLTCLANRKSVIIPITPEKLSGHSPISGGFGWEGTATKENDAFHLGIWSSQLLLDRAGVVAVGRAGNNFRGWGFGRHHAVDRDQGYTWEGEELSGPVVFEIAVKSERLTEAEQHMLLVAQ